MKGTAFVLLGCFALFFAAPSHSYSLKLISEDDQIASRQDTQSGSPSIDAATSGDAAGSTDTAAGENKTIEMDGVANPGNESVPADTQAGKSNVRKRDTRSLVRDMMVGTGEVTSMPMNKDLALYLFRLLGEYGGQCFEQVLNDIQGQESPINFRSSRSDTHQFSRSDMVRWLKMIQDSMSECLKSAAEHIYSELPGGDYDDDTPPVRPRPNSNEVFVPEFLSWLKDIGATLKKCFQGAINFLEASPHGPGDNVQRSSVPYTYILEDLARIISEIERRTFGGGDQAQLLPLLHPLPYSSDLEEPDYDMRSSLDKPKGYRHYSNLPGFTFQYAPHVVYNKDIPNSIIPKNSGLREGAVQIPDTSGINTLEEDVNAIPIQHFSLLNMVLDEIYSRLAGRVSPAVNMDTAPAEGLRLDGDSASRLFPGNGDSGSSQNLIRECEQRRSRRRMADRG